MQKNTRYILLIILLASCKLTHKVLTEDQKYIEVNEITYPTIGISEKIKSLLSEDSVIKPMTTDKEYLNIKKKYQQNNNLPFWDTKYKVTEGIDLIKSSRWHGLNPNSYFITQIDSLFNCGWGSEIPDTAALAFLDIFLTKGIYKFCKHLVNGKLLPYHYHKSWNYPYSSSIDIDSVLFQLIKENRVDSIASYFQPGSKDYLVMLNENKRLLKLKDSLFEYTALQYPGKIIRKTDSNFYVIHLRQALSERKLITNDSTNYVFDDQLEQAVKNFQTNHGLISDGIPGPNTYAFLNWKINDYINALKINMERIRWMPDILPATNLQVNIPSGDILLYSNNQLIFHSRVIVGKYKNQTPVLTSEINYLVYNPCWTVPASIATKKILPLLKKDTSYLDKRNMFVTVKGVVQQHDSIDFSVYNESNFPFKIYQRSDDKNALGKVKFMFPNPYNIYLHDTPNKYLFNRDHRTFSHGCVRVQNALGLSDIILQKLDDHKIDKPACLNKGFPVKIYLKESIPINIMYLTCRFNRELNKLQYFKDIYYLDYKVLNDLDKY